MTDEQYTNYCRHAAEISTKLWQIERDLRELLEKRIDQLEHENAMLRQLATAALPRTHDPSLNRNPN